MKALDEAYAVVADIAERCVHLQDLVADLDDEQLSVDLGELLQAVLTIDRHIRARRLHG